jgi:hypothetical protein
MTMSFAEQVRAAVASAEGAAQSERAQGFRVVLDEFTTGLAGLGVGARIQPGRDARKLTLYLYPLHRPARVNLMLSFFLEGDGVVVLGEGSISLETPEALQQWLLRYVQLPAFLESLGVLREEAQAPVEARLAVDRQASPGVFGSGIHDLVVVVSPEDQEKLDAATKGSNVEVVVEQLNGAYVNGATYATLESAGLVLSVESVEPVEDKLRIKGQRM